MIREDHKHLSRDDPAYWFALLRAPILRRRNLSLLLAAFKSPENIFRASPRELSGFDLGARVLEYFRHPDWPAVDADLEWLAVPGNHLVTMLDGSYPDRLKQIADPPPACYVRGDPAVLNSLQISIVGSRRPSVDGRRIARNFAGQLAGLGITITSGLAAGLDSEAHKGALQAGKPTVAVLGSGIDIIYPPGNRDLAASIIDHGAVISEFPLGYRPLPVNFPLRNRIISGLSLGTIVIEAALNSGSLITAHCAMEQCREVFAVPGSIYNHLSRGCHALIREGAKLVECVDDVLEEIRPLAALASTDRQLPDTENKKIKMLDADCKLLLDNIGKRPVTIDTLVEDTGLPVKSIATALITLEMAGLVDSLPGGEFTRS
jgi:DNA processing protein